MAKHVVEVRIKMTVLGGGNILNADKVARAAVTVKEGRERNATAEIILTAFDVKVKEV